MDLGIAGRKAIICASSKGLGLACAVALAREGCAVTINGRNQASLDEAIGKISPYAAIPPQSLAADLTTEHGRAALTAACPEPDILVTNNAGPPPGKLEDWTHEMWLSALEANMLAPALLIQTVVPGMRARKFGRIVNITSAVVKSPQYYMSLSTSARTGLTAFCKALSREVVADNVTINNLLPQHIDTGRQEMMAQRIMREKGVTYEEARSRQTRMVSARRFGRPEEFGDACAYLCSAQAGYISGQNLQLDGGSYPGLL